MDPSLLDIITRAVADSRAAGQRPHDQLRAAAEALCTMIPTLSPAIARRIVAQLHPGLEGGLVDAA